MTHPLSACGVGLKRARPGPKWRVEGEPLTSTVSQTTASARSLTGWPAVGPGPQCAPSPISEPPRLEAFLVSTGIVALGEMGDKTQLLALLLAARFRKPVPIVLGILVATLINHAAAGWLGGWVAGLMGPQLLRWVIGGSFVAMAAWMLIPDRLDDDEAAGGGQRFGVFGTTVVAFFLAEMGDKTQIATVALAARYPDLLAVVAGTTLGMMLANVPAVLLGDRIARKLSMTLVHGIAAAIFGVLGLLTLLGVDRLL